MHDRAVRRRRAVLVVLVTASLILLTAYFGECAERRPAFRAARGARRPEPDPGGREPRPEAVPRPVRLVRRHGRRQGPARQGRQGARRAPDAARRRAEPPARGRAAGRPQRARHDRRDEPATARSTRASTCTRRRAGTRACRSTRAPATASRSGDPVINGAGLVGKVETAWGGGAVVTLITDPEFATGGITSVSQEPGSVVPAVGAPGDLLFKFVDNATKVQARASSSTRRARSPAASSRATRRRSRSARSTASTSATASSTAASTSSPPPT